MAQKKSERISGLKFTVSKPPTDAAAREGQFYIINNGRIGNPVKKFTSWRNTWKQIIPTPAPAKGSYYSFRVSSSIWKEVGQQPHQTVWWHIPRPGSETSARDLAFSKIVGSV